MISHVLILNPKCITIYKNMTYCRVISYQPYTKIFSKNIKLVYKKHVIHYIITRSPPQKLPELIHSSFLWVFRAAGWCRAERYDNKSYGMRKKKINPVIFYLSIDIATFVKWHLWPDLWKLSTSIWTHFMYPSLQIMLHSR